MQTTPPPSPEPIQELLSAFRLQEDTEDVWRSTAADSRGGRMFGGTIAAQALAAARTTVAADMRISSLSVTFLHPADGAAPCTYQVDRTHDGISSAVRWISALQSVEVVAIAGARFRGQDTEVARGGPGNAGMHPDELPATGMPHRARAIPDGAFDIRYYDRREAETYVRRLWFRTLADLPDLIGVHECTVALISDLYFFEPALAQLGYRADNRAVKYATAEHSMWFHNTPRADDWLLIESRPLFSSDRRGLVYGEIRSVDGLIVGTLVQDVKFKLPDEMQRRNHKTNSNQRSSLR